MNLKAVHDVYLSWFIGTVHLKNVARPPNGLLTLETFVTKLVGDVLAVAVMEFFFFLIYTGIVHSTSF